MAAEQPDRDDEASRPSAHESGSSGSSGSSDSSGETPTASRDDAPAGPPGDRPSDRDDAGPSRRGETREQPALHEQSALDDQTLDGRPSHASGRTEIRPLPPDLGQPDRVGPRSTSVMPPVDDGPGAPRWSARAPVRTPDIAEDDHDAWAEPPRGLLVPILVAVCVLLLVALLGLGSWLIFASRPSGTPASTPTVQNATPPATTAAQTTTTTTTTPPAVEIRLPNLRGLDYETAAAELTKLGFVPARQDEIDGQVPKGQVIGTDPPVDTPIRPGATINVRVSLGLPDATTPPTDQTTKPPD